MTFTVIALVCALGQDPAECQPPTARSVMSLQRGLPNEMACMRAFTMSIPEVASLIDPAREYPKLACERVEDDRL